MLLTGILTQRAGSHAGGQRGIRRDPGIGFLEKIIHAGEYRGFFSQAKPRRDTLTCMSNILVPLDTSASAEKVLAAAEDLAVRLKSGVRLLHVIEPMASYIPVGAAMDVVTTAAVEIDPMQAEGAKKRLEKLADRLRAKGLEVDCEALIGIAADEILEMAKSLGSEFIVLGSHGHGALYHLFSGSVVTGVLKHSACPVVVVPIRA